MSYFLHGEKLFCSRFVLAPNAYFCELNACLNMPDPCFCASDLTYIVDSSRSLRLDMDILHLFSFDSCNHGSCDM